MFHLHLEVEPELGAKIETAIDDHLATLRDRDAGESWQRLRVEAVAELIVHSGALSVRSPEVVVLVDWETMRTGVIGAGRVCETHGGGELAPAMLCRLACDAGILPVVLGGDGVPLDAGRTRRLATREQRRALRSMYRTCAHPDCTRPFSWCRIHHVTFWELFGDTDLDNLIPLCDTHHHLVHEGGWTLTMAPDRVCTWTAPTGRVRYVGDTRDALGPDHPSGTDPDLVKDPGRRLVATLRHDTGAHESGCEPDREPDGTAAQPAPATTVTPRCSSTRSNEPARERPPGDVKQHRAR